MVYREASRISSSDSTRKALKWGIGVSIFMIFIGVISYFARFGFRLHISGTDVWGQLGDYLNMYVSASSLILVSTLTYIIHLAETNRAVEQASLDEMRDSDKEKDERARNRPVLVFIAYRDFREGPSWKIKNISNNVALNVLVSFSKQLDTWDTPVMIYSLGPSQEMKLTWFKPALQVRAVYTDVRENVITSTIYKDRVKIEPDMNGLSNFGIDEYIRFEEVTYRGNFL